MQQHITTNQLNDLTIIQKINLCHLFEYDTKFFLNCFYNGNTQVIERVAEKLSIGKLLEILSEKCNIKYDLCYDRDFLLVLHNKDDIPFTSNELIDNLWNVLKIYL